LLDHATAKTGAAAGNDRMPSRIVSVCVVIVAHYIIYLSVLITLVFA